MKPIVENMGLDWSAQAAKLRANKQRWGMVIIPIPSDGGEQDTVCLPVRKLPAYLASINPNKVREELRARIELYQNESDDALWNYWMNGKAERNASTSESMLTPLMQSVIRAIVKARVEQMPESGRKLCSYYPQVYSRFNAHFNIARYQQLPQDKLAEAIAYLVNMEIRPRKSREAEKAQAEKAEIAASPEQPALPDIDPATYKEGADIFRLLSNLIWRLNSAQNRILLSYPARNLYLSPEEQVLFDNVNDCVKAAQSAVVSAILNVRSACRVKSRIKFVKP